MGGRRDDPELAVIMRRLGEGDEAAIVTLWERYRVPIGGSVQRVARRRGAHFGPGELDGVVFEVCEELARVARSWSPEGGALPWVWARHRVDNVVDRVLGPRVEPLDEDQLAALDDRPAGAEEAAPDGTLTGALRRIVPDLAGARLLAEALDVVAVSARDRELWFEYQYEKHSGNRSPAATVAPVFGLREATVRQAARRARLRVLRLAAREARYAPLADLPLLA